jgi:hypothetical protein
LNATIAGGQGSAKPTRSTVELLAAFRIVPTKRNATASEELKRNGFPQILKLFRNGNWSLIHQRAKGARAIQIRQKSRFIKNVPASNSAATSPGRRIPERLTKNSVVLCAVTTYALPSLA